MSEPPNGTERREANRPRRRRWITDVLLGLVLVLLFATLVLPSHSPPTSLGRMAPVIVLLLAAVALYRRARRP
jgi:protein-S-isoprenylcysteine O-methyltransferase Ste14